MKRSVLAVFVLAACGSGAPESPPIAIAPTAPVAPTSPNGQVEIPPAPPAAATKQAVVLVTDPAALAAIDAPFATLVDDRTRETVFATVRADVAVAGRGDKDAGVGIARHDHRLFDTGWLARGTFELIGVAYRVDRIPVTPDTCGDVRLIYRLGYRATQAGVEVASRLPMTVAVVLDGPPRDPHTECRDAARAWQLDPALTGAALGKALPLPPRHVHQILTNTQVVRWPSAARPDLGGHAEYALREFERVGGAFQPVALDQTPDVAAIARDPRKRAALVAWLREPATVDALALGWARLPAELSATRAVSVSPHGLARRANRPFRQVLAPADVAALPAAAALGSAEAVLRRLDDHTCVGCHQSQTIAGFHLLGEDGPEVVAGNALAVSLSAPLVADRARRAAIVDALAAGKRIAEVDFTRPAFERIGNQGGRGAHCGLGDPGFAAWTCAAGLACVAAGESVVGECWPAVAARGVGDPCELAPISPSADPRRDAAPNRPAQTSCGAGVCDETRVGFPGGMCTDSCRAVGDGGTCGVIAELTPFNNCLAQGRPFPACLAAHVSPAAVRRCDEQTPCRDDYICAREPDGRGGCTPPYFLFQLRVDGHQRAASSQ